tara:strand:+ start:165 stop:482 length:318 start_codon:yes stop_codon:yes gene_type:complete
VDKKKKMNPDWLKKYAHRVIEHMNEDHQNTIVSTLNAQLRIEDAEAKMVELRSDGYFVLSNGRRFFLKLEKECQTPEEYKNELVKNAKKYRAYELGQTEKETKGK